MDEIASSVAVGLDRDEAIPFWRIVDEVARLRDLGERESELVADILRVLATHATHQPRRRTLG
jgi:hypothetical protein